MRASFVFHLSNAPFHLSNAPVHLHQHTSKTIKNMSKIQPNGIWTKTCTSDKNIEIAALFLFLNRTAFNGMYRENQSGNKRGRYNVPIGSYKNPNFVAIF